jgi:hypothetical protein
VSGRSGDSVRPKGDNAVKFTIQYLKLVTKYAASCATPVRPSQRHSLLRARLVSFTAQPLEHPSREDLDIRIVIFLLLFSKCQARKGIRERCSQKTSGRCWRDPSSSTSEMSAFLKLSTML